MANATKTRRKNKSRSKEKSRSRNPKSLEGVLRFEFPNVFSKYGRLVRETLPFFFDINNLTASGIDDPSISKVIYGACLSAAFFSRSIPDVSCTPEINTFRSFRNPDNGDAASGQQSSFAQILYSDLQNRVGRIRALAQRLDADEKTAWDIGQRILDDAETIQIGESRRKKVQYWQEILKDFGRPGENLKTVNEILQEYHSMFGIVHSLAKFHQIQARHPGTTILSIESGDNYREQLTKELRRITEIYLGNFIDSLFGTATFRVSLEMIPALGNLWQFADQIAYDKTLGTPEPVLARDFLEKTRTFLLETYRQIFNSARENRAEMIKIAGLDVVIDTIKTPTDVEISGQLKFARDAFDLMYETKKGTKTSRGLYLAGTYIFSPSEFDFCGGTIYRSSNDRLYLMYLDGTAFPLFDELGRKPWFDKIKAVSDRNPLRIASPVNLEFLAQQQNSDLIDLFDMDELFEEGELRPAIVELFKQDKSIMVKIKGISPHAKRKFISGYVDNKEYFVESAGIEAADLVAMFSDRPEYALATLESIISKDRKRSAFLISARNISKDHEAEVLEYSQNLAGNLELASSGAKLADVDLSSVCQAIIDLDPKSHGAVKIISNFRSKKQDICTKVAEREAERCDRIAIQEYVVSQVGARNAMENELLSLYRSTRRFARIADRMRRFRDELNEDRYAKLIHLAYSLSGSAVETIFLDRSSQHNLLQLLVIADESVLDRFIRLLPQTNPNSDKKEIIAGFNEAYSSLMQERNKSSVSVNSDEKPVKDVLVANAVSQRTEKLSEFESYSPQQRALMSYRLRREAFLENGQTWSDVEEMFAAEVVNPLRKKLSSWWDGTEDKQNGKPHLVSTPERTALDRIRYSIESERLALRAFGRRFGSELDVALDARRRLKKSVANGRKIGVYDIARGIDQDPIFLRKVGEFMITDTGELCYGGRRGPDPVYNLNPESPVNYELIHGPIFNL